MINATGSQPDTLDNNNTRDILVRRAKLLGDIRAYFARAGVLEVETPALRSFGVTDVHLDNLSLTISSSGDKEYFLQTSPEYAMKQLLVNGSGSIYQICKAFRNDPIGQWHNFEFTMLEWYRVGFSLQQLIADVSGLVSLAVGPLPCEIISYRDAFIRYANIDPFLVDGDQLRAHCLSHVDIDMREANNDVWLDLLLTHLVEPQLGGNKLTFLIEYPATQAALAITKKDQDGFDVAERFELYINGVEIANGYLELTDPDVHRERFFHDNLLRRNSNKCAVMEDREFLSALDNGLPECSGVALGIDRLLVMGGESRHSGN